MRKFVVALFAASTCTLALAAPALAGNNFSAASADATKVFFVSDDRLLASDTDALQDIYQSVGGTLTLVSVPGAGAAGPAATASFGGITPDGSKVYFTTTERMVAADTDLVIDVYERSAGTTTLVSVPGVGSSGSPQSAFFNRVSADGSTVVFESLESLVAGDTDGLNDLYQRSAGETTLVSVPGVGSSGPPKFASFVAISANGSKIFFSTEEDFITADTDGINDTYERTGSTTSLVTGPEAGGTPPAQAPSFVRISTDGTRAVWTTAESLVAADPDALPDVYQRSGGVTTLVSEPGLGANPPDAAASWAGMSADATKIFFDTTERMLAADTDSVFDVYERSSGATTLVSVPGAGAAPPDGNASVAKVSSDGSSVIFNTAERMVTDDVDSLFDDYRRASGVTTLMTVIGAGASGPSDNADFDGASDDTSIEFFSTSQSLVGADFDGFEDVYEASGGTVALATVPGAGQAGPASDMTYRANSADGSRMVFATQERLTGADVHPGSDIYARAAGVTTALTIEPGPPLGSPPETTITGTAPNFAFSANETPVSFECSTDGAPFAACTSPQTLPAPGPGSHTFSVRATDPSGNVDATPAVAAFNGPAAATPSTPAPKKCKKGQKLKQGKCVKKKRKKK